MHFSPVLFPTRTSHVCDTGHKGGERHSLLLIGDCCLALAVSLTPPALCILVSGLTERKMSGSGEGPPPGRLPGQKGPHQPPPSSRRTCPLAAPVPHYLLAHRRGRHLGEFWLSPDAPTTPIRQKARFKIRDAKCHVQPRSQERAKDTLRHPLLGKRAASPAYPKSKEVPRPLSWVVKHRHLSILYQDP